MASITPFKINVPEDDLRLLKDKLRRAVFPKETALNSDWTAGVPVGRVKRLAQYWADGYDWRAQESRLNSLLPQFETTVDIDGFGDVSIRFVYQKSEKANSIPLLFVHGWPGSILEVIKILPLLTNPDEGQAFHVVAPSLPNFGFSGQIDKPGFGLPEYATAMHRIMEKLGYKQYVTQGGDFGCGITRLMGAMFPENVLASHINTITTAEAFGTPEAFAEAVEKNPPSTDEEWAGIERTKKFKSEDAGYYHVQSTKPTTLGLALSDSPVALLGWIYEKLHTWADEYHWTDDEILTWVSIYLFSTAGPASSIRIYYELAHSQPELTGKIFGHIADVKLGLSYFPQDVFVPPSSWGRNLGPVVFEARHGKGRHFAAYEVPELLANDVKTMFGENGGASEVTKRLLTATATAR